MDKWKEGRVVKAEQAMSVSIGDEEVMLAVEEGVYYSLNPTAKYIWTLLSNPVSLTDIINSVTHEFEVSEDECAQAAVKFLDDLEKFALIKRVN